MTDQLRPETQTYTENGKVKKLDFSKIRSKAFVWLCSDDQWAKLHSTKELKDQSMKYRNRGTFDPKFLPPGQLQTYPELKHMDVMICAMVVPSDMWSIVESELRKIRYLTNNTVILSFDDRDTFRPTDNWFMHTSSMRYVDSNKIALVPVSFHDRVWGKITPVPVSRRGEDSYRRSFWGEITPVPVSRGEDDSYRRSFWGEITPVPVSRGEDAVSRRGEDAVSRRGEDTIDGEYYRNSFWYDDDISPETDYGPSDDDGT